LCCLLLVVACGAAVTATTHDVDHYDGILLFFRDHGQNCRNISADKDYEETWCGKSRAGRLEALRSMTGLNRDKDARERADLVQEVERLTAENSLLRSRLQECNLIYAHAPIGFMLLDRDFTILSLSEYTRMFARESLHRLLGRKCFEAVMRSPSVCEGCPVERALTTGKVCENLKGEPAHMGGQRFIHQIAVPVFVNGVVTRVLEIVVNRTETVVLQEQLERDFLTTIEALAQLIEIHDPQISGHSRAVREAAEQLAGEMGLKGQDLADVAHAAVLHDIGKIGIPREILDKNGPLSPLEYAQVKHHPGLGERALISIDRFARAREYVLSHHERYDGSGYPSGLKGEGIPLGARILAVADAYAAMTADRSYRRALSPDEALRELEGGSGSQFDPRVVEKFLALMDRQGIAAKPGKQAPGPEPPVFPPAIRDCG